MHPVRLDVRTATGTYPVLVGEGLTDRLGTLLDERGAGKRRFIVTNPVVWRLHGERLAAAVPGAEVIQVPDGERHKHLATVSRIYEALVTARADRGSAIVAIGGGVIGDMAGFAAATFLRGIALVQVPTTLLAQVDASIGGKVGVNLPSGKNLVGSFYPPRLVVTDTLVLRTLSRRELRAGLYEVIKYGMACSASLFARLQTESQRLLDPESGVLLPIVTECCRIKADVVSADEREAGLRRVLNFGHTAGHAIEALTQYRRFRHGEAVGWGMLAAAHIAMARRLISREDTKALEALTMGLGPLPHVGDLRPVPLIESIRHDKKVVDGTLHMVLPTGIGSHTIVDDVTSRELAAGLEAIGVGRN
jgi:3-dehydroquinate synthase